MAPQEIRTIRGSLSRAAFARLLGVTPLTVLRWELPEDNKEARRPRAKMVELLRRLASEGVGARPSADAADDDDDDDSSEPLRTSTPSAAAEASALERDEARVLPLLERLCSEGWEKAEAELVALLTSNDLATDGGRALATLGVVQIQLLAHLDIRAVVTTLLPLVDAATRGELPRRAAARAQVLAALLFGAPDSRLLDPGRVNVHFSLAEPLLEPDDHELRVLLATARLSSARFIGMHVVERAYRWASSSIERATSRFARCIAAEIRVRLATFAGDHVAAARYGEESLEHAERLGFAPTVTAILGERAHHAMRGAATPSQILAITARARAKAQGLPPGEPFIRILTAECEALSRAGKLAEAEAVVREVTDIAKVSFVPIYAIMGVATRLYAVLDRLPDAAPLVSLLESTTATGHLVFRGSLIELHRSHFGAMKAVFEGRFDEGIELSARACHIIEAIDGVGAAYLVHDVYLLRVFAAVLAKKLDVMRTAARRMEHLLHERPSLWHAALLKRSLARGYCIEGRFAEAREALESALATFQILDDVVQVAHTHLDVALMAQVEGLPNADEQIARAEGVVRTIAGGARFRLASASPREILVGPMTSSTSGQAKSTVEKLGAAIERLSVRALPLDVVGRELGAVLADLFPERRVVVDDQGDRSLAIDPIFEIVTSTTRLRFGVEGTLDGEQRSILRSIATVATMAQGADRARGALVPQEPEIDPRLPNFIAVAHATRELKREIVQLSRSNATILVTGESGSGKEVVARAVHDLSGRADKPYVAFNCASVPHNLFEGQLFGYKKGAFTGAASDSPGVIRAADGGTLFLDEIGELPLDTQPKLLRFLENGEIFPLGEQKPRHVDVRVLAATHRDLGRLVREGTFREDLYYRLNVVPLQVPPLRERRDDIIVLARVFITKLAPEGTEPPQLASDAVAALEGYGWPGNVRELRNVIERAMAYAPVPSVLGAEHLRIVRR